MTVQYLMEGSLLEKTLDQSSANIRALSRPVKYVGYSPRATEPTDGDDVTDRSAALSTQSTVTRGFQQERTEAETAEYVDLIRDVLKMRMHILVARGLERIDWQNFDEPYGSGLDEANGVNTIDVWWIIDDGGLTVLIPYISTLNDFWRRTTSGGTRRCPVRLFLVYDSSTMANAKSLLNVSKMVKKFRLGWGDPIDVDTEGKPPTSETMSRFRGSYPKELSQKAEDTSMRWASWRAY